LKRQKSLIYTGTEGKKICSDAYKEIRSTRFEESLMEEKLKKYLRIIAPDKIKLGVAEWDIERRINRFEDLDVDLGPRYSKVKCIPIDRYRSLCLIESVRPIEASPA
jgi:Fe-S-cluster containining protein